MIIVLAVTNVANIGPVIAKAPVLLLDVVMPLVLSMAVLQF
jgi:hypothetical protein